MPCAEHVATPVKGWCKECVAEDLAVRRRADPEFRRVQRRSHRAVKLPILAKLVITALALVPLAVGYYAMDSLSGSPTAAVPMILIGGSGGLAGFWIWSTWRHR